MRYVSLGKSGIKSSVIGLGCMGMSEFYGATDDEQSLQTLSKSLALGITMFDTADMYGRGHNESLLGGFLRGRREQVVLTSKFGVRRDPDGPNGSTYDRDLDNKPAYMRACCEASLKRLGTDVIDVYYVHRMDPNHPIEETVGALAGLVTEGKIRGYGLSEVSPDILRRAHNVHPVTALQSEYSLFSRDAEKEVLPVCRELDIAFIAYSPLGRGILTGAITNTNMLDDHDLRRSSPRFADSNIEHNLFLLDSVRQIAEVHQCTLGQVALAWLLAQGDDVIPIPGTKRVKYAEENARAADLELTADELRLINSVVATEQVAGAREWVPVERDSS